jgi:tRNA threonylcarbamoyladenosine biosynthesis protein TsaE
LTLDFESEAALVEAAGNIARRWAAAGCTRLTIGLQGDLGSGKTTWVRAMLRGLGYVGRVPSPTYTLLESYPLGALTLVHLDLYRLQDAAELEYIGIRDWLARPQVWLLVEWPAQAPQLNAACDLSCEFHLTGAESRRIVVSALSDAGRAALDRIADPNSK